MPDAPSPQDKPPTLSLIYGIEVRPAHEVDAVTDAQLTLTDGSQSHITMHLIEGNKEQVKALLLQSIDAFFDLHEDLQ